MQIVSRQENPTLGCTQSPPPILSGRASEPVLEVVARIQLLLGIQRKHTLFDEAQQKDANAHTRTTTTAARCKLRKHTSTQCVRSPHNIGEHCTCKFRTFKNRGRRCKKGSVVGDICPIYQKKYPPKRGEEGGREWNEIRCNYLHKSCHNLHA